MGITSTLFKLARLSAERVRAILSHPFLGSPIGGWFILLVLIAFFAWLWIGLGIAPWSWRHFWSP